MPIRRNVYPAAGAATWAPYVAAMKDRGVKGLNFTGEPEGLAALERAMSDAQWYPDFITAQANMYDERLVKLGGNAIRNTYLVSTFTPFEDAKSNPALQQYLDLFQQYRPGGKAKALLGVQGFSAWLLWAQAAKECGADRTRPLCVQEELRQGSHAPGRRQDDERPRLSADRRGPGRVVPDPTA